MYVENANRAAKDGYITVDNLEPNPKNPIIAAFFRNIGYADQLGSGVRNLFKYTRFYSGQEPIFKEGDVFQIIVPLNDSYSYDFEPAYLKDFGMKVPDSNLKVPDSDSKVPDSDSKVPDSDFGAEKPNTSICFPLRINYFATGGGTAFCEIETSQKYP